MSSTFDYGGRQGGPIFRLENSVVDTGLSSWKIKGVFLINSRAIRAVNRLDLVKSKHELDHVQLDV